MQIEKITTEIRTKETMIIQMERTIKEKEVVIGQQANANALEWNEKVAFWERKAKELEGVVAGREQDFVNLKRTHEQVMLDVNGREQEILRLKRIN